MINSKIEYKAKLKRFLESKRKPDHSFKTLSQKRKPIRLKNRRLLPDTTLYPSSWTYLVSNEKHPHTITPKEFRKKKLKDGDKVYFERGQIYNWAEYNVTTNNNTFGSYGSGADPIFRGSDLLGTFSSESGGYYSAALATAPLWIINPDGECARQGETAWITTTANSTSTTITATAATLNAFNTVEALANNAKLRIKEFAFRLSMEHLVTGYNTGTGVLTIGAGGVVGGSSGFPFKLYGQKQYATLEGDWWYDDPNNEIWIKTASDPTGLGWRVITENYALNVQGSNFTCSGIEFTQYFESAIEAPDAPAITLSDLNVHDNRGSGFILYGNNTVVTASNITVERCGFNAFMIGAVATGSSFTDCTIDEIGEQANISWPTDSYWLKSGGTAFHLQWDANESVTQPTGITFEHNTMTNLGYIGILFMGDNHVINENLVDTFGTRWNDGGGIYSIHRATLGTSTKNCSVTSNITRNGVGNIDGIGGTALTAINNVGGKHADGLYIDNGCELNTWNNNTSYNNSRGLICNFDTQKHTIQGNTFFGNRLVQVLFQEAQSGVLSPVFTFNDGNHFNNNILVSNSIQFCMEIISNDNDANYSPFDDSGSLSGNYYVRPYGTVINISRQNGATTAASPYTLSTWVTKYGETGGTEIVAQYNYLSPEKAATEIILAVNDTDATINVDPADGTYDDINGSAITNFDLDPYESKPYFIITPVAPDILLDTFTAANGTNISGRSPNIGPVPTIVAGTHAIQSNRMASTVIGIVKWDMGSPDFQFVASRRMSNIADGLNAYARHTDSNNRLTYNVTATTIKLFESNGGSPVEIASAPAIFAIDIEYFIGVECNGNNVKIYVNGVLYIDQTVTLLTGTGAGILGNTTNTTDFVQAATI